MAQRGREGAAKRAKERARQERQEAKRQKRWESPDETEATSAEPVDEMALMEEFRLLSERHAAGLLDDAGYETERHRLFVELGIETDDEF